MISKKLMEQVFNYTMERGEEEASEYFDIAKSSVRRYVGLYRQHFETPVDHRDNGMVVVTDTQISNEIEAREFAKVGTDYETHRIDVNFKPDGTSQYKIAFVPKKGVPDVSPEAYAQAFAEHAAGYKSPNFPARKPVDSGKLLTISLADWHHGKQVWGTEISGGGENWDIHESRDAMARYIGYIKGRLAGEHVDTVAIEALGDLLNVDNAYNTTVSGTQQSEDSRFIKTQWYIENMMVDAVSSMREVANKVVVLIVPGNHDATRILMLGRYLQAFFRNDPGVEILCDPSPRKRVVWGRTLLAYSHELKGNVVQSMFSLWPEDCARCKDLIMNTAHLHTQKGMETVQEYEQMVRVIQHPAMVPNDGWADSQGYWHVRGGLVRIFDKKLGQVEEYVYRPHFTQE